MKWHKNKRHFHQYRVIFVYPCSIFVWNQEGERDSWITRIVRMIHENRPHGPIQNPIVYFRRMSVDPVVCRWLVVSCTA